MKKITAIMAAAAAAFTIGTAACAEDAEYGYYEPQTMVMEISDISPEEYDLVPMADIYDLDTVEYTYEDEAASPAEESSTEKDIGKIILVSLFIGIIIALIVCLIMKSRMKTARPKLTANDYIRKNSFNITRSRDIFIYANVTKKKRVKEEKK